MRIRISGMLACVLMCSNLGSQAVSLSNFNVESILSIQEDSFMPNADTEVSAGARFAPAASVLIEAAFTLEISDMADFLHPLPEYREPGNFYFDGASLQFPRRSETGASWGVFTGFFDDPSSDSLLKRELKTSVSPPEFRAMPAGSVFDPDPVIAGNGLVFWGVPGDGSLALAGYGYWNSLMGSDTALTWDVRASRTDVFFTYNMYGGFLAEMATGVPYLRAGFTGLFSSEQGNSLFIEGILKDYAPGSKKRIDRNIHVLFEPRIQLRPADIALSFFYSPLEEENTNYIGGNLLIGFGGLKKNRMRGGMSVLASIDPNNPGTISPFSFSLTPFYAVAKGDFAIESAAVIHPLSFDEWRSAVQLQLRVKAVY